MSLRRRLAALHERLVPPEAEVGWTAYLWLIYLSFFFAEWFFRTPGLVEGGLGAATLLAFLCLYFSGFRREGRSALLHLLAITALAVAWSPFNSGASVFFIYAAAFAFLVGRPGQAALVVLGVAGIASLTAWLVQPVLHFWLPGVLVSLIIGAANIYFGEQRRRNAELRLSQAEVRRLARVAERERIARDLHDVLGHTLSLIAVKSQLAARLVSQDPQQASVEIESIGDTARAALREVRAAISGFQQQSLDEAMEQARLALRSANVDLQSNIDAGIQLPEQTQAMLALVIREAVTNIIRHTRARHCRIGLQRAASASQVLLCIEDDGRGRIRFDGNGIQGMRARIESLGGELQVCSQHGSRLMASVPEGDR